MEKQTLSEERLTEINQLKSDLQELINLYNQAFTGHQSFKKQNEITTQILAKVGTVQQTLLNIRDLNAQVLTQRQTKVQMQKLQRMQMAYDQIQSAMQSMNSLMTLGSGTDPHSLEIDNTNYSGEIESAFPDADADDEPDHKAGDDENFSQPGGHPGVDQQEPEIEHDVAGVVTSAAVTDFSAAGVAADDNVVDNVAGQPDDEVVNPAEPTVDNDDAEMLAAQRQLAEAQARMAKAQAAKVAKQESNGVAEVEPRNESEQADDHEVELQSSAHQKSESQGSDSGMAAANLNHIPHMPVRNADDSETLRAQAEFEKHAKWAQEHPEEIKRRQEKFAPVEHELAIKWPGSKDYLNKQGQVVDNDNLAVRDVTPDKEYLKQASAKDQDEAENALNKELGKLGL